MKSNERVAPPPSPPTNGSTQRDTCPPGGSTSHTSAPRSASSFPACAVRSLAISTTRRPTSGPVATPLMLAAPASFPVDPYPELQRWSAAILSRPSFAAALTGG